MIRQLDNRRLSRTASVHFRLRPVVVQPRWVGTGGGSNCWTGDPSERAGELFIGWFQLLLFSMVR